MTLEEHFHPSNAMQCKYCGELCMPELMEEHLDGCEHLPPNFKENYD